MTDVHAFSHMACRTSFCCPRGACQRSPRLELRKLRRYMNRLRWLVTCIMYPRNMLERGPTPNKEH